uniref:Uncharacterized protein MANES_05G099600 n=1 Tax=Rhizophora mucronata TaxID=61149 RepID=A0A2P2P4Q6_RHIMU
MAEAQPKRQREETQVVDLEENKKHKSYNQILSLLEEEEDEPTQDLSSLITTLQHELSPDSAFDPLSFPTTESVTVVDQENNHPTTVTIEGYPSSSSSSSSSFSDLFKEEEVDDSERVIRHLLEASDDELGIPNREEAASTVENGVDAGLGPTLVDGLSLWDGLWEFEDVNANYCALVQSELFM